MPSFPYLTTETKIIEYWTCGVCARHHNTEDAARRCMEKWEKRPKPETNNWTYEKLCEMVALRDSGKTFRECGKRYGITGSRATQVYAQGLRAMVTRGRWHKKLQELGCID